MGVGAVVDSGSQAHRDDGRRLRLHGQVRDDVLHERLVAEEAAERRAVGDVPRRLGERMTHQ